MMAYTLFQEKVDAFYYFVECWLLVSFLGEESWSASLVVKGYHMFPDILVNVGLNSKGASSSQQEATRMWKRSHGMACS